MVLLPTQTSPRYTSLVVLLILALFLGGCDEIFITPDGTSLPSGEAAGEAITVSFTDPNSPTTETYRGGPDVPLARAIDGAQLSVDVAVYDLNLWSIRDALIAAHRRGVTVRVVTESDNLDEAEIQDLKDAGIPILGDRRENLMHNKFTVIDRMEVWTGSMNYSTNDAYKNNNNLIRIRSSRLAEDYTVEFEEMFVNDLFGPDVKAETPYPVVSLDGIELEVYFSPDDGVAGHLVELIRGAQKSIYFLAYSFTSDEIADTMLDRAKAGVSVAGVFDESQVQANTGDEWERLRAAGLDVRMDGNPRLMHHKVIIIDGDTVVTGSYNFSANAEKRNDENALIVHSAKIASQYMVEFERVFEEGQK